MGTWYTILVLQSFPTFALTGLIWCMQCVLYPLFPLTDHSKFADFEKKHQRRISWVIMPLMVFECFMALLTLVVAPAGTVTVLAYILLALILLAWISTFCFQVPEHITLSKGFSSKSIKRLISTNWIRTVAWSLRSLILIFLLLEHGR